MQKLFDKQNNRLVFIAQRATDKFWDKHWDIENLRDAITKRSKYNVVVSLTKKYLSPSDGTIIEGGCGIGRNVYALNKAGFKCIRVDFSKKTVEKVNAIIPEVDVRYGDVGKLDFEDSYFAGYWSLGVIEHFWDSYTEIFTEMKRVLKSGGYLFLTFPYMSPLRILKTKLNMYPLLNTNKVPDGFYQFVFDWKWVVRILESIGFSLKYKTSMDGIKGFKDEFPPLKPFLQKLYDYKGNSFLLKGFRFLLDKNLSIFAGHTKLLVMRLEK